MLRELLADDRGVYLMQFAGAWAEDVEFVLARVTTPLERKQWAEAFASTRHAWSAAWAGADGPGWTLSDDLADEDPRARAAAERLAQDRG
jgi:hypothetical protein